MATRVYHINKRTGVTYVYESVSYWDKEKKQPRNKQVCIGKLDPITKELIVSKRLTPGYAVKTTTLQSHEAKNVATKSTPTVPEPAVTVTAEVVGPLLVLDAIHTQLGLDDILKACFPKTHTLIKMMAYYLVCEGSPLSHCESWCKSHNPDLAPKLTSQRISEILSTLNFDVTQTFCKKWIKKVLETDYLCYDITSISSYSESNEYIKYGYNRDKEKLPQLNLAILFGQNNRLPVYYQRTPGNITDVTTLPHLVKTFKALGVLKPSYIMDKGFYSKQNINELLLANHKFMVSVPLNNKWIRQEIEKIAPTIHSPEGYQKIDQEIIYVHTQLYPWGDQNKRCYLHLYYNSFGYAKAVDKFNADLLRYKQELENDAPIAAHQKAYNTFFIIRRTPKRGLTVSYNTEEVGKHIKTYCGFQAIFCNNVKDPVEALKVYRDKDVVEKSFDDLKNSLDMKRLRMHTSPTVDGKLFVQFLALIYTSALRKEMRTSKLIDTYTIRELLDEMDTLTKIKYNNKHAPLLTDITKNQKDILLRLSIEAPKYA